MNIAQAPIAPASKTVMRTACRGVSPEGLSVVSQVVTAAFVALVGIMLLLIASFSLYSSQYSDRAFAGVSVAGVDVGGMSDDEVRESVGAVLGSYEARPLTVFAGSIPFTRSLEELGVFYDVDATVARVMAVGREGTWWDRSVVIASSRLHGAFLDPVIRVDAARFQTTLVALAPEVVVGHQDAYVDMRGASGPTVVEEVAGTAIDPGITLRDVIGRATALSSSDVHLALVELPASVTSRNIAAGVPDAGRAVSSALTVGDAEGSWSLSQEDLRRIVSVDSTGAMQVDRVQIERFVASIAGDIDRPSRNAGIAVNGDGHFVISPAVQSASVDQGATTDAIVAALHGGAVEVPLVIARQDPEIVDADARASGARAEEMVGDGLALSWEGDPIKLGRGDLVAALVIEQRPGEGEPFALSFNRDILAERLTPIADELAVEPKEVQFRLVDGEVRLHSEARQGREVDLAASLDNVTAALDEHSFEAGLVVKTLQPEYTSQDRAAINLPDLLGDSSTYYGDSSEARRHNVERAVELEQGWIIPPDGVFSYAEFMGLVTKENGFITGFGIVADQGGGVTTAPVIGGGICQVSTTIFQAAWWSGLEIVERWAHPYWLNGYGHAPRGMKGLDAMVNIEPNWALDLRFKNTTGNWIALLLTADGENVRAEIRGMNPGWAIDISQPVITNVVQPSQQMIYTDSSELPKGQELRVETAQEGFDSAITRVVKDGNGQEIDRYVLESTYAASRNTTLRGTGPAR